MANAGGRLTGTVLSGLLYQWQGLEACLWASVAFVLAAGVLSRLLPGAPPAWPASAGRRHPVSPRREPDVRPLSIRSLCVDSGSAP